MTTQLSRSDDRLLDAAGREEFLRRPLHQGPWCHRHSYVAGQLELAAGADQNPTASDPVRYGYVVAAVE